ncbi:WapI family immunity protein [Actinoplanes sp. URMC 104]|uniref:WapI family immunity protein n=1 Tax=Actinoplanes sp. URMC 104 TaxID=3423409 RepID=UPI003F19C261
MLVEGSNGTTVSLRPERWQYPPDAGAWDDQWLVISGTVNLGARNWSFTLPCLVMGEARELATWLGKATRGEVELRTTADHDDEPSLSFMEPHLGFSLTASDGEELVLRIDFTAAAAPPWLREDGPDSDQYAVELRLRADRLRTAAETWTRELDALPSRSFASTDT